MGVLLESDNLGKQFNSDPNKGVDYDQIWTKALYVGIYINKLNTLDTGVW
jgi:hypothetical protein